MTHEGILFIGDPHISSRPPGFRSDDYPRTILDKLSWCMEYARKNKLKTALLGDLFHYPRDNANWLVTELIELLSPQVPLAIYGNHDVRENVLSQDDSLSILAASGAIEMLTGDEPWSGTIAGQQVVIGGTSWGRKLPSGHDSTADHVFWMTHHDLIVPGYEEIGRVKPKALPGIDAVINGHIHRHLETIEKGKTSWITPGNIARVSRGDATRQHQPAVLQIQFQKESWQAERVTVPHGSFEDVFYEQVIEEEAVMAGSTFIHGLAEMKARRTESGAGLKEFLAANLGSFDQDVQGEINKLAERYVAHDE